MRGKDAELRNLEIASIFSMGTLLFHTLLLAHYHGLFYYQGFKHLNSNGKSLQKLPNIQNYETHVAFSQKGILFCSLCSALMTTIKQLSYSGTQLASN